MPNKRDKAPASKGLETGSQDADDVADPSELSDLGEQPEETGDEGQGDDENSLDTDNLEGPTTTEDFRNAGRAPIQIANGLKRDRQESFDERNSRRGKPPSSGGRR